MVQLDEFRRMAFLIAETRVEIGSDILSYILSADFGPNQ
jgi:hypothetical protein